MQKPLAYSPINNSARDSSLANWEMLVIAFVAAIMLFMISFALVTQYGRSVSVADGSLSSSSEFALAMPLP
jgi:hypothetical protein